MSPPRRDPLLDVLRCVAILLVVGHHFRNLPGCPPAARWWLLKGYVGVDVFFVLSGWLIGGQLLREQRRSDGRIGLRRFWMRRWLRTLPVYYAVLAWLLLTGHLPASRAWDKLLFLQNYTAPHDWLISWSLCIEEHFYMLLPLVLLPLARLPRRAALAALVALTLLSPAWRALIQPTLDPRDYHGFLARLYVPTHLRLDGLFIGVTLAALHTWQTPLWTRLARRPLTVGAVGLALLLGSTYGLGLLIERPTPLRFERLSWPFVVVQFTGVALGTALLIVPGVVGRHAPRLGLPGGRWLAEHAYTLYLTHELALWWVLRRGPAPDRFWATFAITSVLALMAAMLLRWAVEKPGLALRDRWSRPRAASAS